MNSNIQYLYGILQSEKQRYVYFLLAISAASIAFAVSKTNDIALNPSQIPLGIAVSLWAFSFFAGCRNRIFYYQALYMNMEILRVESGQHEISGHDPAGIQVGREFTKNEFNKSEKKVMQHGMWQFWLYVHGSIFFIAWHILEMYLMASQS